MKTLDKLTIAAVLLAFAGYTPAAQQAHAAQQAQAAQEDIGKREYEANCAVCHGLAGTGDGPFAQFLKQPVPTITRLRKDNKGTFPFERVYMIIDGREEVKAHGPRDMPIWGDEYAAEVYERHGRFYGGLFVKEMIRGRILALIAYIDRLQAP